MQELLHLAFEQLRYRYAGPAADHLGDVFFVYFFFEQALAGLLLGQPRFFGLELALQLGQLAVFQLGGFVQIVLPLGLFDFDLGLFDLLAQPAQPLHAFFFGLPLGLEGVRFGLQIGHLFFDLLQPVLGSGIGFLLQRLALDFELHDAAQDLVQIRRHGIDLGAQLGGRFVHQIDGFIGQEAIADVAVRQDGRGHQRRILDPDAVMDFIALAQPAQNRDGVFDARLVDQHGLEPAFESCVLFDVLAVFVERGCADAMQLAARQHRLQQIAGVHGAFGLARADHGVQLVDEQNDLAFGRLALP